MSKINVSKFKRFSLYDDNLFIIDSGTKLDKSKMSSINPSVNFVGRANANNGVTDFIDKIKDLEPYPAGLLTISLGGEYLGSCFIQDKPFYTSQNVNVLIPKHNMSDYCKKYIATVIFKEGRLYYKAFVDELNRHMKTDFSIPLPVDSNGRPDWAYMEYYMKNIEANVNTSLEKLLITKETELNKIDISEWGIFLIDDLFEAQNTGNILARNVVDGSGETPFVTASGINNGVAGYIDASKYKIIPGNSILVGGKTFTLSYQEKDFVSNDSHNFTLKLKDYNATKDEYLYLISVLKAELSDKYSWGDAVTKNKILKESIHLPVDSKGKPNFKYMSQYIKDIEKTIKNYLTKLQTIV